MDIRYGSLFIFVIKGRVGWPGGGGGGGGGVRDVTESET